MTFTRRLAAFAAMLALSVTNIVVCAGWQPTAEARMACCMNDTRCLMHKTEGHDHSAKSGVTQTQADNCCAASAQRHESSSPASAFASSGMIAFIPSAVFSFDASVHGSREWRALVPLSVSSVPKHLLLSVLIV